MGDFIDLCPGPHLPHTGVVKAFKLMSNSAIHTEEDERPAPDSLLNRIYGVSFTDKAQMKEFTKLREEALKRDHRLIGK